MVTAHANIYLNSTRPSSYAQNSVYNTYNVSTTFAYRGREPKEHLRPNKTIFHFPPNKHTVILGRPLTVKYVRLTSHTGQVPRHLGGVCVVHTLLPPRQAARLPRPLLLLVLPPLDPFVLDRSRRPLGGRRALRRQIHRHRRCAGQRHRATKPIESRPCPGGNPRPQGTLDGSRTYRSRTKPGC